jgi:hypothetical protein
MLPARPLACTSWTFRRTRTISTLSWGERRRRCPWVPRRRACCAAAMLECWAPRIGPSTTSGGELGTRFGHVTRRVNVELHWSGPGSNSRKCDGSRLKHHFAVSAHVHIVSVVWVCHLVTVPGHLSPRVYAHSVVDSLAFLV